MQRFYFLVLAVIVSAQAGIAGEFVREIPLPVDRTFIPRGYDTNDGVQLVVEGSFKNLCYQLGATRSGVDKTNHTIYVKLMADEFSGNCPDSPSRFHHVFYLGRLPEAGNYIILDLSTQQKIGKINVTQAPEEGPGTDDTIYAPLLDAVLLKQKGKDVLFVRGVFSSSCQSLGEVTFKVNGDVVIALPSVDFQRTPDCKLGEFAFEKTVPVDTELPKGDSYLLHVRTMAGQSINKMMHALPK